MRESLKSLLNPDSCTVCAWLYVQLYKLMLFCPLAKPDNGFFVRCEYNTDISTAGATGLVHNIAGCRHLCQRRMASIEYAKIVVNIELPLCRNIAPERIHYLPNCRGRPYRCNLLSSRVQQCRTVTVSSSIVEFV
jgi:hypothetical protein